MVQRSVEMLLPHYPFLAIAACMDLGDQSLGTLTFMIYILMQHFCIFCYR